MKIASAPLAGAALRAYPWPMRIVVMGAGGVGGYYGALLAKAGHDVTFIARGAHLAALRQRGITVESVDGASFTLPVRAMARPAPGPPPDLVLFTVKTYDTASAAEAVAPCVGPDTAVLTLQNGVSAGAELRRLLRCPVLEGPVYVVSALKAPGVIAFMGGRNRIFIGAEDDADAARAEAAAAALRDAGAGAEYAPNVRRALWTKLVFLGPLAALTALGAPSAGAINGDELTRAVFRATADEYAAAANASGADLPLDAVDEAMRTLAAYPADGTSSMARDRHAGRPMELEALVGDLSRRGKQVGVPTPLADAFYALLRPYAAGRAASPP